MSLVSHFSDRLLVMYAGQIVEIGPTRDVFDRPTHPYSQGLLDAFPSIRGPIVSLTGIPGSPPNLAHPPSGCRFHPRCPMAFAECSVTEPELYPVGPVRSRCLLHRTEITAAQRIAAAQRDTAAQREEAPAEDAAGQEAAR
jgi:peptide/nickel transport system ATP-binding protein